MTDSEYKAAIKRIRPILLKWQKPCGLGMWRRVDFTYHRDAASLAGGSRVELDEHARDIAGCAVVDWEYREATIHLNVDKLSDHTDEEIDYIVRHEICHVLVNEMREWQKHSANYSAIKHEERVVSDLAMILGWVYMEGVDAGKLSVKTKKKR